MSRGREVVQLLEGTHVVADGAPGLDDAGIGEESRQWRGETHEVQTDQHHEFRTRELHQRRGVDLAFLEGRTGFGIEPEDRLSLEAVQGAGQFALGLDKQHLPFIGQHGQLVDGFLGKLGYGVGGCVHVICQYRKIQKYG